MTNNPTICLLALATLLTAPACTKQAAPVRAQPSETTKAGEAPRAVEATAPLPTLAAPAASETLYKVFIKNAAGQSLIGVKTMLLSEIPEGLYIREPRRKTVIGTYKTPAYGRVHYLVQSDSKPKYLWIGDNGVLPFITELESAAPGRTYERTVIAEISPIATLIIEDHQGMRVPNAIVTMRPEGETANKFSQRGGSANYGTTQRSDDLGEVQFTRPVGQYRIIATKENGTSRVTRIMDWTGNPAPVTVRLPEKSETAPQ